MTLKLESTTTELREGCNLEWYHHLTHITCVQKYRGYRQKLDALRVQTGPSLSKYEGLRRKLICFKGISFLLPYLTSQLFLHIICTIQSGILKFQSTRVLDENSCVSKAFHFSKLISIQDFFCIQYEPLKSTYYNFNPF